MEGDRHLVIVIAGPTAVGKSDAAMALATILNTQCELISADSVQMYRGLDIGSNKPTPAEQEQFPHHLIDCIDPSTTGTVGSWTREALRIIDELHERHVVPIVVGGSCMYIDWLVNGEPDATKSDPEAHQHIVEELKPYEDTLDWDGALRLLAALNPERAQRITLNNWRQLARQLEVARQENSQASRRASRSKYDLRCFFLSPPDRLALFHRIDTRCILMMQRGFLEEVAGLLETGMLQPDTQAGLAIGYRQVIEYFIRPDPQEHDVEAFRCFLRNFGTASRNYATKQLTWFLKDSVCTWVTANPSNPRIVASEIARLVSLSPDAFREAVALDAHVRSAQMAQGQSMAGFSSRLESVESMENLDAVLKLADACTNRVPENLRKSPNPTPTILDIESNCTSPLGKVYWHGRHRTWGWGAVFKFHKQGVQLADAFGWQCVKEDDTTAVPVLMWSARKSGDFPIVAAEGEPLPLIRPFPEEFTRHLDDKAELAANLVAAGHADAHPPTWTADEFMVAGPHTDDEHDIWFLKHTQGVKGQSVHLFQGAASVEQKLVELGDKNRRNFVVQRGVSPPSLRSGRKWVLRVHALLRGLANGSLKAYCHRDMICLEHGQLFSPGVAVRASHISSAGNQKHWPKPHLLEDEGLTTQVLTLAAKSFASVWQNAPRGPYTPHAAELFQVFGLDIIVDESGRAWLIEINNYPAIASGTMAHVDVGVYTTLVRDVFRLVVLPITDGAEETLGGFIPLDVESFLCTSISAEANSTLS